MRRDILHVSIFPLKKIKNLKSKLKLILRKECICFEGKCFYGTVFITFLCLKMKEKLFPMIGGKKWKVDQYAIVDLNQQKIERKLIFSIKKFTFLNHPSLH